METSCPACRKMQVTTRAACGRTIGTRCNLCKGFTPEREDVIALRDATAKEVAERAEDLRTWRKACETAERCQKADRALLARIEEWLKDDAAACIPFG